MTPYLPLYFSQPSLFSLVLELQLGTPYSRISILDTHLSFELHSKAHSAGGPGLLLFFLVFSR